MTDQINKSISEVLRDFFNKNQLDEFISLYQSSKVDKSDSASSPALKQLDYKIQDGINYRSQIDLLVTFAGNNLAKEKFL